MLLKKAEQKVCGECKRPTKVKAPEVRGCDNCRKPISGHFKAHWFGKHGHRYEIEACSWTCLFRLIRKEKRIRFLSLPFLAGDRVKGQRTKDFFAALRGTR